MGNRVNEPWDLTMQSVREHSTSFYPSLPSPNSSLWHTQVCEGWVPKQKGPPGVVAEEDNLCHRYFSTMPPVKQHCLPQIRSTELFTWACPEQPQSKLTSWANTAKTRGFHWPSSFQLKSNRQLSQQQFHQQMTQEHILCKEVVTSSYSTCLSTQLQIEKDAP